MPNQTRQLRWSFPAKVLAPVLVFLVLIPCATLWIVSRHSDEQMRTEARHTLATADAVLRHSLQLRARHLVSRFRSTVNEPRFRAVAQLGDSAAMTDFLRSSLGEFGEETEVAVFSTASDRVRGGARRDGAMSPEEFARATAAIIVRAFDGDVSTGVIHTGGRIFNVVSVPVVAADHGPLLGTLTLGIRLGLSAARELQALTHTELLLLAGPQVAASTMRSLEPALLHQVMADESGAVVIEGEHYLARAGRLDEVGAQRGLSYVLLSSYEARLRTLRRTQAMLLGLCLAGLVVSATAAGLLLRRFTRPLRELRNAVDAVSRGDFSQRVDAGSPDECGRLATAFNHMTASVQAAHAELEHTIGTLQTTQSQLLEREQRLRKSLEELRQIITSAHDHAIFTLDLQGRVVSWNPGAERLLGYSATEAAGLAYASFFSTEDRAAARPDQLLAAAVREGQQSFEGARVRRDGSCFWADATISALPHSSGKGTTGFVEIARDFTVRQETIEALRRARDKAEAASRARGEFLASLSHELHTPMQAVLDLASRWLDQKQPGSHQPIASSIRSGAEAALTLIEDLRNLTRLEAGNLEIHRQDFDLRTCVERAAAPFALRCAEQEITVDLRFAPDLPPIVTADGGRVGQIFTYLIRNAVKFTVRGRIDIVVARAPDVSPEHVRCIVSDTGLGIPHEHQADWFKPFLQVDASAAHRDGGTGIGLALAKRLVELLGGTITCESSPGQGSRFAFTLRAPGANYDHTPPRLFPSRTEPAPAAARPAAAALTPTFADHHPMRTLVVEDNLVNAKVLTLILAKLGYKADTAANGIEALARIERNRYDVVFMDLQMPDMDGLEATRLLRTRIPVSAPPYILAFTANASPEDRGGCASAGMHDFESKPANMEKISRALERAYAWITANGPPTAGT